jgi:hypothetical protein
LQLHFNEERVYVITRIVDIEALKKPYIQKFKKFFVFRLKIIRQSLIQTTLVPVLVQAAELLSLAMPTTHNRIALL